MKELLILILTTAILIEIVALLAFLLILRGKNWRTNGKDGQK